MDSINRLREKYERRIQALENREQILGIVKWVLAAIAAGAFLFGVVKVVLLLMERTSKNKKQYSELDECAVDETDEDVVIDIDLGE